MLSAEENVGVWTHSDIPSREYLMNLVNKANSFLVSNPDSMLSYSHEIMRLSEQFEDLEFGGISYSVSQEIVQNDHGEYDNLTIPKTEDLSSENTGTENGLYPFIIVLIILSGALVLFMFRSSSRKRMNKILVKKNTEIDGHRRRVLASIQYAKTIQDSLLNNKEVLNQVFPFSSVYFRAKDVVSGDMFWVGEKNHKKIIAAVDCTGHGVPGAFMSLIANESINTAIKNSNSLDPGKLIVKIHDNLMEALDRSEGENTKEGMDISICVIDELKREIEYAGAKNSVFIKHRNELTELKAAPLSIGGMYSEFMKRQNIPFPTHKVSYKLGSEIFLFTDGILDQFGGEDGKKLNKSGFKKLIAAYNGRVEVMDHYVTDFMDKWMGENEQLDDMLLLSVRL